MKPLIEGAGSAGDNPADGLPRTRVSDLIDGLIRRIGESASWLWLVLVLVIIANVAMRYVFGTGLIIFEEIQWHIFGVGFLIGLSYCLQADRHVRIDVLSEHFRPRTRAWIELIGILLFLLPFSATIMWESIPFVVTAWNLGEVSPAPGGLPYRWAIKSALVLGFGLLALAGFSRLLRCSALLFGLPRPIFNR